MTHTHTHTQRERQTSRDQSTIPLAPRAASSSGAKNTLPTHPSSTW